MTDFNSHKDRSTSPMSVTDSLFLVSPLLIDKRQKLHKQHHDPIDELQIVVTCSEQECFEDSGLNDLRELENFGEKNVSRLILTLMSQRYLMELIDI